MSKYRLPHPEKTTLAIAPAIWYSRNKMNGEQTMPKDFFNDHFISTLRNNFEKMQEKGLTYEEIREKIDISELYQEVLKQGSDSAVRDFKHFTKEAVKCNEKEYNYFAKSHDEAWGECLNFSEMMYTMCTEAMDRYCDFCYDLEKNDPDSVESKRYTFVSFREICARACQEYLEIVTLVKNGLADGAFARWRSLDELCIIIQFIQEQGEIVAKAFYEASFNSEKRNYEWAKTAPCFCYLGEKVSIQYQMIRDKCSQVNEGWNNCYKSACKAVHANPMATFGRIGNKPNGLSNGVGRSIFGIDEPAVHAAVSLNSVINTFLGVFASGDGLLMMKTINKWTWFIRDCYLNAGEALNKKLEY